MLDGVGELLLLERDDAEGQVGERSVSIFVGGGVLGEGFAAGGRR